MADADYLLSDEEVQRFIVEGYVLVRADFAAPLHQTIYQKLEEVFEKEGNVGNNILPRVPEIHQVFEHPKMRGALTSLLGDDYTMNPHRHCHLNAPGSSGQSWHKDCYVFDHNLRQPRFHWLLALYYPQDVTEDMGPTGILPGHQYYNEVSNPDAQQSTETPLGMCGPAGTVALVNFDAWHRAMANSSDKKRYMLKFQFARLQEPRRPTWNFSSAAWEPPAEAEDREVWLDVWRWMCGEAADESGRAPANGQTDELLQDLGGGDEAARLHAAYVLGQAGAEAVPGILEALRREAEEKVEGIEDKTPANAHGTNPTALHAAQALIPMGLAILPQLIEALKDEHWLVRVSVIDVLANLGPSASAAISALTECLEDAHWWARRGAAEALGRMGELATDAVPPLAQRLGDEDRRVRRMAAHALAQIGCSADGVVQALRPVLEDEDRYNRFYAGLALRRLDDPQAQEALMDVLFAARWCPVTSKENPY